MIYYDMLAASKHSILDSLRGAPLPRDGEPVPYKRNLWSGGQWPPLQVLTGLPDKRELAEVTSM